MIKIAETYNWDGWTGKSSCPMCWSILEYEAEDVARNREMHKQPAYYIICPVCGEFAPATEVPPKISRQARDRLDAILAAEAEAQRLEDERVEALQGSTSTSYVSPPVPNDVGESYLPDLTVERPSGKRPRRGRGRR